MLATSLQQNSESSVNQRAKLTALANQAFAARKQAEANEQAATGSLHKASKFISLCCAGLAAIGLLLGSGSIISRPNEDKPVVRGESSRDANCQSRYAEHGNRQHSVHAARRAPRRGERPKQCRAQ